ncbi:MAG: SufS family cysteine desulfurase [Actinomycetes bacterium]|nr:MAG: cysteine desulfurase [Actinomycetota bacterium]
MRDVRGDFPLLKRRVRGGRELVYLDSAATSQRPHVVLNAVDEFETLHNGAVQRGAHLLAEEATEAFEGARDAVARFVGAREPREIVWTGNATAALNLVANGIGNASAGIGGSEAARFALKPGDSIVITQAEHHANIVPWQQLAVRTGTTLKWIEVDADGVPRLEQLDTVVDDSTRVLAFGHASNVTGVVNDVAAFVARAREVGALTVLDACQSVPHMPVDFSVLGVDFAAFSGHKMLGPTGIGALWGRAELLDALPPSIFGGGTVQTVTLEQTTWHPAPTRFEAGSQPVAQAIGLGAAARYLSELGMGEVFAHERALGQRMRQAVAELDGVRLLGPVDAPHGVLGLAAFSVDGVHPHDVGQVLDDAGIAVRVGHHCAQPLHRHFGVTGSSRASAHVYTTDADVDAFIAGLERVIEFFGVTA